MKKITSVLLAFVLILANFFQTGCKHAPSPLSQTGFYFDTVITITLYGENSQKHIEHCFAMAEEYENLLSATKENSDIWNLNHSNGQPVTVSEETLSLIKIGLDYAKKSQGAFDISVGQLSSLWKFDENPPQIPNSSDIISALQSVDYHNIQISNQQVTLKNNAKLDLGGIAKGYIADRMKDYLIAEKETSGLINLGGNVLTLSAKSNTDSPYYHIAIQKPFSKDGESIASVKVIDKSVVTSGVYQRYFKKNNQLYHHILNLEDGYPCKNDLYSVTILSDRSVDGDALSTMVFLMGLEDGLAYVEKTKNIEAIFVTSDNKVHVTSGMGKDISYEITK